MSPARRARRPSAAPRAEGLRLSEDQFLQRVIETAKWHHWQVTHFRAVQLPSGEWATPLQGDAGFPDLALARAGVVLLAELKTDTGRVEPAQKRWLAEAGPYGRVWRPRDWPQVLAELSQRVT